MVDDRLARGKQRATGVALCAQLRVRAAHQDWRRSELREQEWLVIEWPESESEPVHYWLSNLPASTALRTLVTTAMTRWRIERDYQVLKQEFGLSHYEGRSWRGFHHHATLCIAAYGFLVSERLKLAVRRMTDAFESGTHYVLSVLGDIEQHAAGLRD